MALEYRLVLAGDTPVEQVAGRAFPDPEELPTGVIPLLTADLFDRYGFSVAVRAGRNGYVDVESDEGSWEWEPEAYVSLSFRMDKFADQPPLVINMLTAIRRVLNTGSEDAAFILNGDVLLLTRFDGKPVKHRRTWWENYPGAADLIPSSSGLSPDGA
ncbi:SitI3 family protein [Actinoplanes friuliensis]|uniref:Uncharacterized protein n=1 Tax=Actinoplanes friuliensis DSM 7358 TaxID=1246995 RepID=U5WBB9_9ACTN|nr:SitI3 family protein [Actinoplanes friuliensis]AGZ46444.1 hypothetical protein AFR_40950 [Actinoplanes friuliensis DSM 7358]